MIKSNHFDVAIIGVGAMGSAACWHLSQRGLKVLAFEQFDLVHQNGSHAGQSRIIRKAYYEHPDYVPLLRRSYENWALLEKSSKSQIYHETGIIYFGKRNSQTLEGVKNASALYQIPVRQVPSDHYRQFRIPSDFEAIVEPEAGFLKPEQAIFTFADEASKHGAIIKTNQKVVSWKQINSILEIQTEHETFTADKLVFTSGSWTKKLLPSLHADLKVTQQVLAWIQPPDPLEFSSSYFPCWFIEDEKGIFYGFPFQGKDQFSMEEGIKIGLHKAGKLTDPDHIDRVIDKKELDEIRYVLGKYIPIAGDSISHTKTCLYTYSNDENFIIDHLPGFEGKVTVACGFSGHGFKFSPVVGEVLADLTIKGSTDLPIDFLKLNRLKK